MLRREMSLPLRVCAVLAAACFSLVTANGSIVIEKAEREVRLHSLAFWPMTVRTIRLVIRLNPPAACAQINAAKYIVLERQTATYKNTGSQPVAEILLCHPADQAASRAFFEVCPTVGLTGHHILRALMIIAHLLAQVVEGIEDDSPELLVSFHHRAHAHTPSL